jgi:ABC-2 type transport system ATP-binding protein
VETLRTRRLEIQTRDLTAARSILTNAAYGSVTTQGESLTLSDPRAVEAPDEIARLLVSAGTPPTHLAVVQENLEEHFLQLIGAV